MSRQKSKRAAGTPPAQLDLEKPISTAEAHGLLGSLLAEAIAHEPSDAKLGALFFSIAVMHNNLRHFGGRLDGDELASYAEAMRASLLEVEAGKASDAAVEKALRLAAAGDDEKAGRFIREHLTAQALTTQAINAFVENAAARAAGGAKTAQLKREKNDERNRVIRAEAKRLLDAGENPRNIPSKIEALIQLGGLALANGKKVRKIGRKTIKAILDSQS